MEAMNLEPVEKLLSKLDQLIGVVADRRLVSKVGIDKTLWNTQDIADYLCLSKRYVQDNIVHHHTFPSAVRVDLGCGKKAQPRWFAGQVISWIEQYQEGQRLM